MNSIKTQDFLGLQIATSDSFGDTEPRCRDVDLGRFLGYSRPRDVRKLIERELSAKNLNDYEVRATVARVTAGGRPRKDGTTTPSVEMEITEYWLTESTALFIASRSDTKAGAAILKALIAAWKLARDDRRVQNIIQLCWSHEPKPVQRMFAPLIRALLNMRGEDDSSTPPWARLLASMIYAWAFGPDHETGQQSHRRSNEPECKRPDYWWLNEDGLRQLQRVIDTGIDYAAISAERDAWGSWVSKMRRRYDGMPLQMSFFQSPRRISGQKKAS